MSSIVFDAVSFRYPHTTRPQLDGFSFTAQSGTCTALLGPSGCAKTTVLRLIAGLETPQAGRITIGDTVVAEGSKFVPPERRKVGMIFQDYALFPHMTVAKNVAFGLSGLSRGEKAERVERVLDTVGLAGFGKRYPHELSGGQQQRVALARALAPAPQVLLFDEPFSNLDTQLRQKVRREIKDLLVESNITAVLVTHDHADADALADTVITMDQHCGNCPDRGDALVCDVEETVEPQADETLLPLVVVNQPGHGTQGV